MDSAPPCPSMQNLLMTARARLAYSDQETQLDYTTVSDPAGNPLRRVLESALADLKACNDLSAVATLAALLRLP